MGFCLTRKMREFTLFYKLIVNSLIKLGEFMPISKQCYEVFTKLAIRLTQQEYTEATSLMYDLYMDVGASKDYDDNVVGMMEDIDLAKKKSHQIKLEMRGKTLKLIKNESA